MMNTPTLASTTARASMMAVGAGAFVKPPAFALLPQRAGTRGLLLSVACHALATMAVVWLPFLFPVPHVLNVENFGELTLPARPQPLILPAFSQLAATETRNLDSGTSSSSDDHHAANLKLQKRDYAGPQEIISVMTHSTNRVQTILRPDLNAPPNLPFPLRLQSMVKMPAPAAPVLEPLPAEKPSLHPVAPSAKTPIDVPIVDATVPIPKLANPSAQADATSPADNKIARTKATEIATLPDLPEPKTVIVVNAVDVPDSDTRIPDAQLAGSFTVGPAVTPVSEKQESSAAGTAKNDGLQAQPLKDKRAVADKSKEAKITATNAAGPEIASAHELEPKSGESDHSNTGSQIRLSISGGVSDHSRSAAGKIATHSYGMTITAGGSSGGASRDMGVFNRGETVYSVAIPMTDAGGGPDWPMQYARWNAAGPETGLLSPPFAQKKIGAIALKNELVAQTEPVFVTGVIDEQGKLQSLRALHVQDRWAQLAIRALQQWVFLPAQSDGRAVASKVLIGVTVVAGEE